MAVTIPKTQYVGINLHRSTDESMPLGFLTPGGTNAGAKKRKSTVDSWCGHGHTRQHHIGVNDWDQFELDHPDAELVSDRSDPDKYAGYLSKVYRTANIKDIDYKILDEVTNEPRAGFRITKSISRGGGSWSGSNKVVRIEDPRGFELEISVDNLVKMMSMTTFVDGVCQEECVWGRDGANNVLLPVNSEPYKEAFDTTTYRAKKAISLRDVNYGDTVELKKTEHFEGLTGIYMGSYHVYSMQTLSHSAELTRSNNKGRSYSYDPDDWTFIKSHKRYVIKVGDKYKGVSGCKIHKIVETVETPVERPDLNAVDFNDLSYGQVGFPIFLSTKKIPVNEIAQSAEFVPTTDIAVTTSKETGPSWLFTPDPASGHMMRFYREYYSPNYHNKTDDESLEERIKIFRGEVVSIDISNNTWEITGFRGQAGKGVLHMLKHPLGGDKPGLLVEEFEWSQLQFTANDTKFVMDPKCSRGW